MNKTLSNGNRAKQLVASGPEFTLKEQRKNLNEIRKVGWKIRSNYILSNGMTAGDIAIRYVTGLNKKRIITKNAAKSKLVVIN